MKDNQLANDAHKIAVYFNTEMDEGKDAPTITMYNDRAKGFISSYQLFPHLAVRGI